MSGECIICYRNWTSGATFEGGQWSSGLPASNMGNQQPTEVARTVDASAAATTFVADLGEVQPQRVFSLVRHNLTSTATWRIRVGSSLSTDGEVDGVLYDTGDIDVWPTIIPFGLLAWGAFNWGQALDDEETDAIGPYAIHVAARIYSARYVQVDITDTSNADGYAQIGVFLCSDGFQPTHNMEMRWSVDVVDPSKRSRSHGSQSWFDERAQLRKVSASLGYVTQEEAESELTQMFQIAGKTNAVLFIPKPNNALSTLRHSVYGTFTRWTSLQQWTGTFYRRAFDIEELR